MKKKIFAVLALSVLLLGMLCACGKSGAITAEQAQKIALEDAGLKQKDVSDVHSHVVTENNIPCYSIHISVAEGEYSYLIHAGTGEILDSDKP